MSIYKKAMNQIAGPAGKIASKVVAVAMVAAVTALGICAAKKEVFLQGNIGKDQRLKHDLIYNTMAGLPIIGFASGGHTYSFEPLEESTHKGWFDEEPNRSRTFLVRKDDNDYCQISLSGPK